MHRKGNTTVIMYHNTENDEDDSLLNDLVYENSGAGLNAGAAPQIVHASSFQHFQQDLSSIPSTSKCLGLILINLLSITDD